ncbi:MAG: 3-phosphoshikimate 1-carboxyvinyltransferase [Thermodesulfovibrionales bacterium]|nr:3-phosphoshikimate 1-carboxyvinyltransferase [Thermodesulfovibrionales bacterium]
MATIELGRAKRLKGEITPPPDKSISHRAVILSSISGGRSVIRNFLVAGDTMSTLNAMAALGVGIKQGKEIIIEGAGLHGLKEPLSPIDCGNSGTTMRLLSGILSGNPFFSVLTGDESLSLRPMARVITPLRQMGSNIISRGGDRYPPIAIKGGGLKAVRYKMPVASAQVKSAILLAGLYAEGSTEVIEPVKSRDHTERMLPFYGADVRVDGLNTRVTGGVELKGGRCDVPADFSSAAFFIVAGLIVEGSEILIKKVGLNPTRTGLLDALKRMGASIKIEKNPREVSGEPVGDLYCKASQGLHGIKITGETIPSLIDEFPILCIAAACADGVTTIKGAEELRVKESDRIKAMADGLRKMGVEVKELSDGLSIKGGPLKGASIDSRGDHRIAMAFSIAGLCASGKTIIKGAEAVDISFPGFYEMLKGLRR